MNTDSVYRSLAPEDIFARWSAICEVNPGRLLGLGVKVAIFIQDSTSRQTGSLENRGAWIVECRERVKVFSVAQGTRGETSEYYDCSFSISGEDLAAIISGELNLQQAYLSKRLKVTGELESALKINVILDHLVFSKL